MSQLQTFRASIQLMRLPALFTALADIFAGYLLTRGWLAAAPGTLGLLLIASAGLYLSGMVFNDVFDVEQDRQERPNRPIPSGRITRKGAAILGAVLMGMGLVSAAAVTVIDPLAGANPLMIAVLTAVAILLYDGVVKRTPLGPVMMGTCRFFNVLLGASTGTAVLGGVFTMPQLAVAAAMGVYVVGVTWFARKEAVTSGRGSLIGGLVVLNLGLGGLLYWIARGEIAAPQEMAFILLAVIAMTINKRALVAIASPAPHTVQSGVRTMLLSIITLQAVVIYAATGNILLTSVVAIGLLLPAIVLGQLVRIT